jgi:signal transduction histidine kinase
VSLTTRLLIFSQIALAAVLLVFSGALYGMAHLYLHRQASETVERAVTTLVATLDIEEDSVEWEPLEREVSLGPTRFGGEISWFVTDATATMVDRAPGQVTDSLLAAVGTGTVLPDGVAGWTVERRLIHPPGYSGAMLTRERTEEEIEKGEYPALVITTGVPTAPLRMALQTLALGLALVSLVVWLAALLVGRGVCRRALRPLTAMAEAAREMAAEDAGARLPPPGTRGELEELHTAISGLLERLHAALGRERRFTAEASHQLRTPLGTILGQVEVALRRPRSPEEYTRVLGVVRRQAIELSRSVEALLFLARSDADAPQPSRESLHLGSWLSDFMDTLRHQARFSDISIQIDSDAQLWVDVHPPLLRELLGNLIENALKYSPPGTPIDVRVEGEGTVVTMTVEDRGPGIMPADLPHLFEPFFRSSAVTGSPGSGLGLAVAARIASAFGGCIRAENRPGGGARFTVTLPARSREHEAEFISASRSS